MKMNPKTESDNIWITDISALIYVRWFDMNGENIFSDLSNVH